MLYVIKLYVICCTFDFILYNIFLYIIIYIYILPHIIYVISCMLFLNFIYDIVDFTIL